MIKTLMEIPRRFINDKIYLLIRDACRQLYPVDVDKASVLFRKEIALRNTILNNKKEKDKLIKVLFLIFSKNSFDLADIVIFNSLTNVQIKFAGIFEYLNQFITIPRQEGEEEYYLLYDSSKIFNEESEIFIDSSLISRKMPVSIEIFNLEKYSSRIRKHLMSKLSCNGINPLPFFEFNTSERSRVKLKNFRCKNSNFISQDNNELIIVDENEIDFKVPNIINADEVKTVDVTEENLECFYDIDGISGFAKEGELHGFKSLIDLNHSKKSKKRPITRDRLLKDRGKVKNLKDLFAIHFAEFRLPVSCEERINLFLIINCEYKQISKTEESDIRSLVYNELLFEMRESLKSSRLKHSHMTFMKSKTESRSMIQAEEHSDIYDSNCVLSGKIDSVFIENVLRKLNQKISKSLKVVVFFEAYGTKNVFSDLKIEKLFKKLDNLIDFSVLNADIDICSNIGIKNLKGKTLCCGSGLFGKGYGIDNYYLFNCEEFATYHGHTIKRSPKKSLSSYISLFANGISKANIYVPLLTQYLPRDFKSVAFPCHTSSLACSNFHGWTADNKSIGKFKTMIKNLKAARDSITQHMNLNIDVRAEFRISSVNIPVFSQFVKKLFINREMRYYDTKKLIRLVQQGIDNLLQGLVFNKEFSIEDIAKLGIIEIYFFEKFIRGGHNLHILPSYFRDLFFSFKSKWKINSTENFENVNLNYSDCYEIVKKLFKYSTKISSESKNLMKKMLEYIKHDYDYSVSKECIDVSNLNENPVIIEAMVEMMCKSVCSAFRIDSNHLYIECEESNKLNQTPISSKEIIDQYFVTPHCKVANELYVGIYRYLTHVYINKEALNKLLVSQMIYKNIKYFVKNISNRNPKLRKISYYSTLTDEEIVKKIEKIKSSVRVGFEKRTTDSKIKAPKTVLSEHLLINYGLRKDRRHSEKGKQALLNDMRYPFFIYAERYKIENSFKQYERVSKKHEDIDIKVLLDKFNIDSMTLEQTVEFLNTCDRYIDNAEALKYIDELSTITKSDYKDIEFVTKEARYYEQLVAWQAPKADKIDNYEFLFKGTSFNYNSKPNSIKNMIDNSSSSVEIIKISEEPTIIDKRRFQKRKAAVKATNSCVTPKNKRNKIKHSDSSDELMILESVISPFNTASKTSSSGELKHVDEIINSLSYECENNYADCISENPAVVDKTDDDFLSKLTTPASIVSNDPVKECIETGFDHSTLYEIDSFNNLKINPSGKIAFNILLSHCSSVSKKLFFNMCKKDLIEQGLSIKEVLEFIDALESKGIIKVISKNKKSMRLHILNDSI